MKNSFKTKYLEKQKSLSAMSINPAFPKIVKIDICNMCNYSCVFCPQSKQKNKVGCIEKELCLKIIKDAYVAGGRELCLSMTGEPLINKDLEEYIRLAKEIGYTYVFLNTNAYFLDEKRAQTLLEAGIDSIKVSVNASKKNYELVHGIDAYERVIENIKTFDLCRKELKSSCKLYVSYVAVKQTIDEVEELKEVLDGYIDEIIVMNANNRGGSISEIEERLYAGDDEFSFQYPCSQLFNNVYVTAEGYMIICCQDFENLTVVADLHEETIYEAWNNEKFTSFRKRYLERDLKGTLCQNCINNTNEVVVPLTKDKAYYDISKLKENDLYSRIKKLEGTTKDGQI